jgi:ankyrin repeat protein
MKKVTYVIFLSTFWFIVIHPQLLNADGEQKLPCRISDYVASSNVALDKIKNCVEKEAGDVNEANNMIKSSGLYLASYFGRLDIVKYLVEHGANVNQADIYNRTPLMMACCNQEFRPEVRGARPYTQIAKYLIDHGANVNARASLGDKTTPTPLGCTKNGISTEWYKPDPELIKYLKSHGATE